MTFVVTDNCIKCKTMDRGGPGNLDRSDKWSFCLTAARMAADQEGP
jgi:hypothetical protein